MKMGDKESYNGTVGDKKRKELSDAHVGHLITEKNKLKSEEFPLAHRLLDEELKKTQDTGKASFDNRYIDLFNDKPVKVVSRVMFPTKEYPNFNFVGKLLGPKGGTLKQLQEHTKCRMLILGKGSMRDKKKEEELRQGGDSKFSHLSDELHVEVSCVAPATEAHNRIAFALHELQAVLVPDPPMDEGFPPYMDDGPMMRGGGMRGPIAPLIPNPASKAKVMGFLEKARQAMEFQPPVPLRRFGPHRGYQDGGYPRGDEGRGSWVSGYKAGGGGGVGGGFFPKRAAPYARP